MLFNTWHFAIFFFVVFGAYVCLTRRAQNVLLLLASYYFYACWNWKFLSLLWVSTVVDYTVARMMPAAATHRRRKLLLLVSIATNLGILGFFKYCGFFVESAAELLAAFGLQPHVSTLQIVLPVGISFYTFQTMAYTIDVYRGRLEPTRDPIVFGVYVSFFPQLVAGPIERAQNLIPQFEKPRRVGWDQISSGCLLILIGLTRKVVIADTAAPLVDAAFGDPGGSSAGELIKAALLFGLQIYGDFAGYSDIARGTSRLLGIELMENFQHPYFATSITDFWRRWHVSLSSWLRDYLYIPLGGNRGPAWFVYRNLMLTMLLGGLWHGANWTFVVWGAIHGVALSVHKFVNGGRRLASWTEVTSAGQFVRLCGRWLLTMLVVTLAWIFFRAPDVATALTLIGRVVTLEGGLDFGSLTPLVALSVLMLAIDLPQYLRRSHTIVLNWHWVPRGVSYAALTLLLVVYQSESDVPFIYFQF